LLPFPCVARDRTATAPLVAKLGEALARYPSYAALALHGNGGLRSSLAIRGRAEARAPVGKRAEARSI